MLVGDRVLAFNRCPMQSHGRVIGSVTTLRDRTELSPWSSELGTTRATSDTLRAQTHEFANQLHTISGLLHLQEYDEVVRFVDGVSRSRTTLYDEVTSRVEDPTVAALLIAKASLATERGVALRLLPDSRVGRMDDDLSRDLTTVVGNLVDNALDAVASRPDARVDVLLREDPDAVRVTVHDSGPGVPQEHADEVFRQGYTTKAASSDGGRGFGLALSRLVCRRRGGDVTVHNDEAARCSAAHAAPAGGADVIRVLIVDDDFMVAKIHTGFVARTPGFEVAGVAHTGAQALAEAERLQPDLVLLDMYLPDTTGLDLLQRMREAGARPRRPGDQRGPRGRDGAGGAARRDRALPDQAVLLRRPARAARALPAGVRRPRGRERGATRPRSTGSSGTVRRGGPKRLPKGFSAETLRLVEERLREAGDLSAAETAARLGVSRVSARRYLEHLVDTRKAEVRLRYGEVGRPERRYQWR